MRDSSKTMAYQLLEWLGKQPNGATLTEIQFYIWTILEGKPEYEFWESSGLTYAGDTNPNRNSRKTRGHWNTALYGGMYYHDGLLHLYCKKVNGKWVLDKMPKQNEIIYIRR